MVKPSTAADRLWAYATLGKQPDDARWEKLDADAKSLALNMSPDDVARCFWSLGALARIPTKGTLTVLEIAAEDTAPEMSAKSVANAVWSYARLKPAGLEKPDADCWEALEAAILRHCESGAFAVEDVVNILWAFATLPRSPPVAKEPEVWLEGKMADEEEEGPPPPADENAGDGDGDGEDEDAPPPPDEVWIALEATARARLPLEMTAEQVHVTLWVFAKMGTQPEESTWAAFEAAVVRVAPEVKGTKILAMMAWAYATLDRRPEHKATRWLMHNAVLQQPTGSVQVGWTGSFARTRAESKQATELECSAHTDAEGWLRWAMHEPDPPPPARHEMCPERCELMDKKEGEHLPFYFRGAPFGEQDGEAQKIGGPLEKGEEAAKEA